MILALVLFSIALAVQPAFSYPLGVFADSAQGFDISTDFDPYFGPWNYGNRFWGGNGGWSGGNGGWWGGNGGWSGGYGGWLGGNGGWWGGSRGLWPYDGYVDNWDYDYGYGYGPVRTVDFGRDRLVRDFAVTETDNWVRDQTSYRAPTRFRYGNSYGGWPRRAIASGFGGPRTSSLRTGGDLMFMRR